MILDFGFHKFLTFFECLSERRTDYYFDEASEASGVEIVVNSSEDYRVTF